MSFDDESILQDYIARLLSTQDERDEWLDEDDLKTVARDLGLSDEDLARIEATTEAHRQRGQHFSQHGAWDDAVAEYRQAVVLDPFDVPLVHALAVTHARRYEETRDREDRETAERYTRRCIELDPNHQPSYELLTALKQSPATAPPKPAARRAVILAFAMAMVVIAAAALVYLNSSPPPEAPPPPPPPPPTATVAPGAALPSEMQIPVRLLDADNARGLHLDVQRSLLNNYDSTFSYTLHATLLNQTDELHRLRMKMALVGADGAVVQTKYFDARSDHQPYLRPGDTAPVAELIYEKQPAPRLQEVQLSVDIVEREPAASAYDATPPIPVTWEFTQPAHLDVEVYERESRISSGFREQMHFLTLAAYNQGTRSVQHLRLKVTWFDAQDATITSELTYVVPSTGPAMRSGETWLARAIGKFPEGEDTPFARYAVTVVEAE